MHVHLLSMRIVFMQLLYFLYIPTQYHEADIGNIHTYIRTYVRIHTYIHTFHLLFKNHIYVMHTYCTYIQYLHTYIQYIRFVVYSNAAMTPKILLSDF